MQQVIRSIFLNDTKLSSISVGAHIIIVTVNVPGVDGPF